MPQNCPFSCGEKRDIIPPVNKRKPVYVIPENKGGNHGISHEELIMRSVAPMRTAKIGYIIISTALCVLGVLLIAVPDFSVSMLGIVCGITLIVFGCVKLTGYFSRDLYRLAFQYDLTSGIVLIALGVIMLVRPGSLMTFICITLGLFILTDGLFKLQIAMDSKRFGIREWWLILALAVITGICGLLLMLRPGEGGRVIMVMLGITLISEGVLNLGTVLTAVRIIKNQQPDIIDVEYEERKD